MEIGGVSERNLEALMYSDMNKNEIQKYIGHFLFSFQRVVDQITNVMCGNEIFLNGQRQSHGGLNYARAETVLKSASELMRQFVSEVIENEYNYLSIVSPFGLWRKKDLKQRIGFSVDGHIHGELRHILDLRNKIVHNSGIKNDEIIFKDIRNEIDEHITRAELHEYTCRMYVLYILLVAICSYHQRRFDVKNRKVRTVSMDIRNEPQLTCQFLNRMHNYSASALQQAWEGLILNGISESNISDKADLFNVYKEIYQDENPIIEI